MIAISTLGRSVRGAVAALAALMATQAHALVIGTWGDGPNAPQSVRRFELRASEGYTSMPDGAQIYSWGYGNGRNSLMQVSGPTLLARQGECIEVTLFNDLPVHTSVMFPGHDLLRLPAGSTCDVPVGGGGGGADSGPAGSDVLARQVRPGASFTYRFQATMPGTYLYQSGTNPSLQTEMGLLGALIVYPRAALNRAYDHAASGFDRETLFVVSDIDSDIHQAIDEQVKALRSADAPCIQQKTNCPLSADLGKRFPKYWTLNGRASPDVFSRNFAPELPHQPYNTLPRLHPGERMLLRVIGAGTDLHPMHHHGNNSWAIAKDGRMLASTATSGPDLAFSDYTIQVVPGQTYDAIWTWTGAGLGWDVYGKLCDPAATTGPNVCTHTNEQRHQLASDRGKPIPVKLPSEFELAYGEFYSGSPYLGDFGIRPVGAGATNTTGAFFHMFHSHNEREVVNGGIFPGGMMTMMVIEPPGVQID